MRKDYNLEKRRLVIGGFVVAIVLIYIARLVQLQVLDSTYKANADSNAFMEKVLYPSRGLIYDRNDSLVVIFSAMIFLVQAFTLHNWPLTLLRIGASSLLTITLLLALDSLVSTRREKRL